MERTRAARSGAKTDRAVLMPILSQSFKVGFLNVRYYGLTFVAAVIAAYFISRRAAIRAGIALKAYDDIVFWTVLVGFLSARVYYVLFYFDQYRNNLSEVYKIWHGGLAIYGGLIGGALAVYFLCRKYKIEFLKFADIVVLGLPVAQAIGRLGNFFNYEAFGKPASVPWKMFVPAQFRPEGYQQFSYFHPAFAYEIIWNLIVFGILWFVHRKTALKPNWGFLTALYILLYSIGRFVIEGVRLDSAYFGPFKGDQLTAVILILLSLGLMAYLRFLRYNKS